VSEVTNLMLSFSILEREEERIAEVNRWLVEQDQLPLRNIWDSPDCYGGSKHMEVPLYGGAFPGFPLADFLGLFRTLPWSDPERLQAIVRAPNDAVWRIVDA
jgi:hypothetical protein